MTANRSQRQEGRNATHIDDRRRRRDRHILAQAAAADLSGPAAERPEGAGRSRQERKIQGGRSRRSRAGRGDLRRRRRHPAFRRLFGRRPLGPDPAVQHHRLLQSVRGGAQEGRQARGVRLVQPCGRLLSAPPPDRHRRHRAPRQPLRRQQGVRRGGRRALCRQARARRHLPAHRQFRRDAARSPPAFDLAEAGRSGAALPHRARSSRHSFRDLLRRLLQRARLVGQSPRLRARLSADRPRRRFSRARDGRAGQAASRIRSAISTRAARSAAWSSTATRAGSWTGASASACPHPRRCARDNPTC